MPRTTQFTEQDLTRIRDYETRTREKIIYTYEEKCQIYSTKEKSLLRNAELGIQRAIHARLNLDNADSFDTPDDTWKLKVLEENLEAIKEVLRENPTQTRAAEEANKPLQMQGGRNEK